MKLTFGQIKFFAQQFVSGIPIPIFTDNRVNRAINNHINRIRKIRTRRKYYEKAKRKEW
jgi:hypothetical protein